MTPIDGQLVYEALRRTGTVLAATGARPRRIVVIGGAAGLLAGLLNPSRTTGDCDVVWQGDEHSWTEIERAAHIVAAELNLPERRLHRESTIYAHLLPLGWD